MNEKNQDRESLRALMEAVVNEQATAEQLHELQQHLLENEQARDAWLSYINLHSSLSRWFLAGESVEPLDDEVADLALQLSREGMSRSSNRQSRASWLGLLAAVCLLLVVGLYPWSWLRTSSQAAGPAITQVSGEVFVQDLEGASAEALLSRSLAAGESIVIRNEEGSATLRYADGTQVVLLGSSLLTIEQAARGAKQLNLKSGLLQADVSRQPEGAPMQIITPQTRVLVLGTRFELVADDQDGTRLDLESGRVELVRGRQKPLAVEPNSIAIIPNSVDPIRVSPRPIVLYQPQRETGFPGLKSIAFAEDGKTIIAATRWQALYWYDDDRMEVTPLSENGRHGISLRQQVDSLLAYFDHNDKQLVLWDAQSRQPLLSFDDHAGLKRQFSDSSERPSSWNPASDVSEISSQGNWLAFQSGREFRLWRDDEEHWPKFPRDYDRKFVSDLAASPDGETLAVAVRRDRLDLVDVNSGKTTNTWSLKQRVPFALKFSASGRFLAVGLAGRVFVYDVAAATLIADFEQPGLPFLKIDISADGRYVAASSLGNRVWLWDVTTGEELPLLDMGNQLRDLAFSPDGERLAVLSRTGRLAVWEVASIRSELQSTQSEPLSQ